MNLTALLSAAAWAAVSVSAVAAEGFDGTWSVELRTEKGSCDASRSATLGVQSGRIEEAGLVLSAKGTVDARGRVSVNVSGGGDTMTARGSLMKNAGSGTWVSLSGSCSGRWSASRQG